MKNKYSDGSLRRYIEYFVFRHVFLHEQVFMGKFLPSPFTYLPRTMSLFRFGFTRKSLDTVTKSENIQATQKILQSLRNQETREKLNLNQTSSLGKANEIENTKRHRSATFLGLYTMKKRTPWSAKFAVLFPKLLTNLAPCLFFTVSRQWYRMTSRLGFMLGIKVRRHKYWKFNETASKASWWFSGGQPKNTLGK